MQGFVATYCLVYFAALIIMTAMGYAMPTAFAAITACLSGMGASIGQLAQGYHGLGDGAKLLLTGVMLLGRLELIAILALLSPSFWID